MIVWIVLGLLAALLAAWLVIGAAARRTPMPERGETAFPDPDTPEALARYGAPEVAEMLEEQGRSHELRGLGFRDRR